MKKTVLLLFTAGICIGTMAQNSPAPSKNPIATPLSPLRLSQMQHMNDRAHVNGTYLPAKNNLNDSHRAQVSRIPIGSSYNAYGYLDASTTAITANKACHLIVMTHREDASKPNATYGTGSYEAAFSTDKGVSWDSDIVVFKSFQSGNAGSRYPNGVIFNPAGNTNPLHTFDAFSGPHTDGTAWSASVYGSIRLDSSFDREDYMANGVGSVKTQNNGNLSYMQSCDDSTVHVIGEGYNYNASGYATRFLGAVITTGKFVNDSFSWSQQVIKPHFWNAYSGALANGPVDSGNGSSAACQHIGPAGMAWSQDGSTGYVVFLGNLDSAGVGYNYNFVTYQPIVYKSTDHGNTWNMMPPFNFRTLPNLLQRIDSTTDSGFAGVKLPYINVIGNSQGDENDYDLTVDMNNNLHIFASVGSAVYANPDSAFRLYSYSNLPRRQKYIFDLYTTNPTGGWQARYIDSLMASVPSDSTNNGDWSVNNVTNPYTYVAYGARIQASRTTDGSHIFCIWEDDAQGDAELTQPDIFGQGYDVTNSVPSPVHKFTNDGKEYFLCVSNIALDTGSSCPGKRYIIPCAYVQPQNSGNDGTAPVNLFYQNDLVFVCDSDFADGVNNVSSSGFSVSPNYPNPFTKTTQFTVTLSKESTVSVDVINLLGQKIWSMMPGKMGAGVNTVNINGSSLSAGIYFYRVTVNENSITQKMVIE